MNEARKLQKASYHLYTFLISKMVSSLGANVYTFGMSMFILSITGSALSFATNLVCSILPRTLLAPIVGTLVDRFSRKFIVLSGQAGIVLSISGLLVYSWVFELSITAIYVTTVLYTIFSTFTSIGFSASISNLVDQDRIQKALSFNQLSLSISGIGGPIIGGMLFGFVSMKVFLFINVTAYVITFLLEATMDFQLYSQEKTEQTKKKMLQSMQEGWQYLQTKPVIANILWVSLWLNLLFTAINVGGDFILIEKLKMDVTQIGFTEAASAIGMLFTALYFATRSNVKFPVLFAKRSILGMSALVATVAFPLLIELSSTVQFIYYLVIMFLFGSLGVLTNTPIGVMFQKEIDEQYRGRIFGILEMVAMGLAPVGTLIFGVLYDVFPAQYVLFISSIALILVTLFLLRKSIIELAHPALKVSPPVKMDETFALNYAMHTKKQMYDTYLEQTEEIKRLTNPTF